MQAIRVLKSYRGYRAGETFVATASLAAVLIESGVAVADAQGSFLARQERAIYSPQNVETAVIEAHNVE